MQRLNYTLLETFLAGAIFLAVSAAAFDFYWKSVRSSISLAESSNGLTQIPLLRERWRSFVAECGGTASIKDGGNEISGAAGRAWVEGGRLNFSQAPVTFKYALPKGAKVEFGKAGPGLFSMKLKFDGLGDPFDGVSILASAKGCKESGK